MATDEPQPSTTSGSLNPMPSSTFSFTAPFPLRSGGVSSAKQRRVSLPSSPRFSPTPTWSFRDEMGLEAMSANTSVDVGGDRDTKLHKAEPALIELPKKESIPPVMEKKPRKKWTEEETQMLVEGCNKWGVGNWKVILNDTDLTFDNRSPVDLKDRFRTFFPDAYKQHYPNAKTHLSSKVRASLPDGTSIFEKTRSKKRRPFTPEEDEALKRGYDKHGTLWASILKDPVFQAKNRRSTDLRDRFRNAFPDLYEAAGYKPRNNSKKKKLSEGTPVPSIPVERLQEEPREAAPKLTPRRKRASTAPASRSARSRRGILDSATCSDSEENSSGDEEVRGRYSENSRVIDEAKGGHTDVTPQPQESSESPTDKAVADSTMASCSLSTDSSGSLSLSEAPEPSPSQTWTAWGASCSSPTRRPTSDVFLSSQTTSPTSIVFGRRNTEHTAIGNSAWATEEWLSPNPRLEPSLPDSSSSSFIGGPSPVPSSPFSFSMSSHGVMDRYDLFPATFSTHNHDYTTSEIGLGDRDTHSAFSEADMFNAATASYRGFTHHSNSAGDLIFAVGRSQPHLGGSLGLQDSRSLNALEGRRIGLGISHLGLPGIDEIPLSAISLHDRVSSADTDMEDSDIIHSRGTSSPPDEGMSVVPPDLDFHNLPLDGDILASTPTSLTNPISPIDLQSPASIAVSKTRPSSAHAHHHLGSTQFRSFSQPPTDHRTHPGPPPHAHTSPFPNSNTIRTQGIFDSSPPPSEAWRAPNDFTDLPFLDLHYYKSNSTHAQTMALLQDVVVESAQALDLAGWGTSTSGTQNSNTNHNTSTSHPISIAPSLLHAMPASGAPEHHSLAQAQLQTPSAHPHPHPRNGVISPPSSSASSSVRPSSHHRVQSAVSPDDLILKKMDNKRKRASWDGGAAS